MSKTNNVVEGTEMVPFDVENGNMEIVPVNDYSQDEGELTEVTPGQAALVMVGTGLVGYGLGKLGELAWKKVVRPGVQKFVDKWNEKHSKDEEDELEDVKSEKPKKNKEDLLKVETEIHDPSEDDEENEEDIDDEYREDLENENKYEKATKKIMAAENKKKNKKK